MSWTEFAFRLVEFSLFWYIGYRVGKKQGKRDERIKWIERRIKEINNE